jgi:uncharacterized protein
MAAPSSGTVKIPPQPGSGAFSLKRLTLVLPLAAAFAAHVHAGSVVDGPMSFKPHRRFRLRTEDDADVATAPWIIPAGYVQTIVSDESDLNLYVANDWST